MSGSRALPSAVPFGFNPLFLRGTEALRFGERSRAMISFFQRPSSPLASRVFGSVGRFGERSRSEFEGGAWRGVGREWGYGLGVGGLVRRPFSSAAYLT